jgi:hypothetical protein
MKNLKSEENIEKRSNVRKPYSGHIFFSTKNGFYEGRLKNYSDSGLFIETEASLSVGDIITIALPYVEDNHAKYTGEILRCDKKGFGIELFKERSETDDKILNKLSHRQNTS